MTGAGILIIDDEPGIRRTLASILEDEKYKVFTSEDAIAGIGILGKENVALVFLDVLLPRMGGLEALEQIRRDYPQTEVVMISGHANVDMAVRAVKLGAFDFLEKPISLDKVLTVCRNALTITKLKEENKDLKKNTNSGDEILGTSAEIEKVRALIVQAAASDARILIRGENGTGKELAARAVHRLSNRSNKPFVEVNCAAIPDTLIESELFGHEKGAFTDAYSGRKGRFELASGGTLFLDEIGDMSLAAQAKVLRAIQEQKIERVGGEKTIDVDVRIVAATNQDLETAAEDGRFRQDLFFRLNVIPIKLPPLRDRKTDIPLLLYSFLKQFSEEKIEVDEAAIAVLMSYPWPGNIRELRNFAERLAIMYPGGYVGESAAADLLKINTTAAPVTETADLPVPGLGELLEYNINQAKENFEKYYLEFHLSRNNGIISRTAEAIGIYPSNLHAKLKKYGIIPNSVKD
ncbi:MAG: sigma-54 dependent transcriptional regulator [Treponema sp.]|nr:sigma-54 dependent transcriptional regulator [Treponema sp.]